MSRIGDKVADSIQRHTSYLKAPQVIFSLFDEHATATDRQKLASALSALPRPDNSPSFFKPGKLAEVPLVCTLKECVGSALCEDEDGGYYQKKILPALVTVRSYLFFQFPEDRGPLMAGYSCCTVALLSDLCQGLHPPASDCE